MSGIYIHIPFCKKACNYCDFHFSTTLNKKSEMVDAICKEICLRKDFFNHHKSCISPIPEHNISTIYFGGGTPSLLSSDELNVVFETIYSCFSVNTDAEITLEANPDDLDAGKIAELKHTPINRLSIGVQSFRDKDLKWMNRSHSANDARRAMKSCLDAGFTNINADLIYGIPGMSDEDWEKNLAEMFSIGINHLSAYMLTVEHGTLLHHQMKTGNAIAPDEHSVVRQFEMLVKHSSRNGFIHYEISNFCKPGFHSKHNSSYWSGEPYLGVGASAHSFDGDTRYKNIANNPRYIQLLNSNDDWFESERLSPSEKLNELILLGIRTIKGCNLDTMALNFGEECCRLVKASAHIYMVSEHLAINEKNCIVLTESGKLIADKIASDLFADDEDIVWRKALEFKNYGNWVIG